MPKQSKQEMLTAQTWEHLNNNIIEYSRIKADVDIIKTRQEELKKAIITDMGDLNIKSQSVQDITDEYSRNVNCTLVAPTEISFNLAAVARDIPKAVKHETVLSLDDAEHIAAFKIKLKEFGLTDMKIRKLINETMTVTETEKVDEKIMQKKIDMGDIEDISKYATIIQKPKYIKVTTKEINV